MEDVHRIQRAEDPNHGDPVGADHVTGRKGDRSWLEDQEPRAARSETAVAGGGAAGGAAVVLIGAEIGTSVQRR